MIIAVEGVIRNLHMGWRPMQRDFSTMRWAEFAGSANIGLTIMSILPIIFPILHTVLEICSLCKRMVTMSSQLNPVPVVRTQLWSITGVASTFVNRVPTPARSLCISTLAVLTRLCNASLPKIFAVLGPGQSVKCDAASAVPVVAVDLLEAHRLLILHISLGPATPALAFRLVATTNIRSERIGEYDSLRSLQGAQIAMCIWIAQAEDITFFIFVQVHVVIFVCIFSRLNTWYGKWTHSIAFSLLISCCMHSVT
mmetsp:Transcript_127464/g.231762  ORF Transcript_127464/g.231762 Transcript_127464/m.231762 type:complete len:254 (+) Transcript_127464:1343-2104(+)